MQLTDSRFSEFLATISLEAQRRHAAALAQIQAGNAGSPPWVSLLQQKLTRKQARVRSYYLAESVADYFRAFGSYPSYDEIRIFFLYATRKARFTQP